ncbi:LapA family protein [Allosphingosinicella flava]|uniref:LapA family protein n=1 Tax=Allosphingosinicella flava TaxID=2771430 RepID=A0A7T2LMW1_9SPHN|nr:LapA family protein [Sphingosinicella flava]QPQ55975.1 LapA family protein [Sphingosinicella flava]
MHFLKTLFWVVLAVAVVLFSSANWNPVTLNLWGGLQADVKLPVLILAAFLLGFVPTFAYFRTRLWTLHRRLGNYERQAKLDTQASALSAPAAPAPVSGDEEGPVI